MFGFTKQAVYIKTVELNAEITVLKGLLEQKDKEIEMWKERGERLKGSHNCAVTELKETREVVLNFLKDPTKLVELKCKCKEEQ